MIVGRREERPWAFVPLLYFMQAIPVTLVQEVSLVVFKDLGVANEAITRWTSLLALPWTLKLLWGPLVDLNFTKRKWVTAMQGLIAVVLATIPFLLNLPHPFAISVGVLFVAAIFGATCDIATDGFYLLALSKEQQAGYVGIQSTLYRLGRLFCIGLLVAGVGWLQKSQIATPLAWAIAWLVGAAVYGGGWLLNRIFLPYPPLDAPGESRKIQEPGVETAPSEVATFPAAGRPAGENLVNLARTASVIGLAVSAYFVMNSLVRLIADLIARSNPALLHGWLLTQKQIQAEDIQLPLCALAALACFVFARATLRGTPMGEAFGTFVRQKGIAAVLAFMLFYRFGEAMVTKMAPLFMKDAPAKGGLGFGNDVLGYINGVAAVIGIVVGGILGGLIVAKFGLRRMIWPMAIVMHLPNLLYLWAAYARPAIYPMYGVAFMDQFGYGFGFAGYSVFLMSIAQRSHFRTAHYAIATGLGAFCIMVAGILSGVVQQNLGYTGFFLFVVFATIPGMLTLLFIPLPD